MPIYISMLINSNNLPLQLTHYATKNKKTPLHISFILDFTCLYISCINLVVYSTKQAKPTNGAVRNWAAT